nr:SRPBCC family protein [Amycolatopsis arida]
MGQPSASGTIEIGASADEVYRIVSDPGAMADLADEYSSFRWLGDASTPRVGARFRGRNRRGARRWSTVATITDAEPGVRFAFDVTFARLPVSRWQYDIRSTSDGCGVTESTWERRPAWLKVLTSTATGVWRRAEQNQHNITTTLRRLKERVESARAR